jgi:5-(carboxyamino)imidazole ribonucleotide synthase
VLHTTQHRVREKSFLRDRGLPVTPFVPVNSRSDLDAAIAKLGLPAVLKTASWGYDGKGQVKLHTPGDVEKAWNQLGSQELILEGFIDFACEVSVVGARGLAGDFVAYGPMLNAHRNHILDISSVPADVPEAVSRRAIEITREVFKQLDVIGTLCVEFFVTKQGELLINELAPRPHNSGHLTIDAHVTCQFEQQVRAVCGLPLGSAELLRPAAMANLLGDEWFPKPPRWSDVLAHRDVKLHLYGKAEPRVGRKMGHLTALADNATAAIDKVMAARNAMQSGK